MCITGRTLCALSGMCLAATLVLDHSATAQTSIEQADFDGNGIVDFGDFLTFAEAFGKAAGESGYVAAADLDASGRIDFSDFLVFAAAFAGETDPVANEPTETFVYVADIGGEIQAYNTATNFRDPSRSLLTSFPRDVHYGSIRIYVSALDTFYAFTPTGERVFTLPLADGFDLGEATTPGGSKMALSPDQQIAYISESVPAVEVINLETGQSEGLINVRPNPAGVAISADGQRLYVTHGSQFADPSVSPITVLDTETLTVIDTISVGENIVNRIVVSPEDGTLYTNSLAGGEILALDPVSGSILNRIDLTSEGGEVETIDVAIAPDGRFVYAPVSRRINVLSPSGVLIQELRAGLVTIDAGTFQLVDEIELGQLAFDAAISPDGQTAYVLGVESIFAFTFRVSIIDLATRSVLGSLTGLDTPSSISIIAGKLVLGHAVWPDIDVF